MATSASNAKEGERAALLRRMLEQDGVIADELYAPDAVNHQPWDLAAQNLGSEGDDEPGEDLDFTSMFTDRTITIEDAVEDGDDVVVRWRLRGIHTREIWGIKPTNAPVNATGQTTYRFADGKIVESWGAVDCTGLGDICSQVVLALIGIQGIDQSDLQQIIAPSSPSPQGG
jgi:hypothetical protein